MHLSVRTVFATILTLSALEVVASSSAASGRVGGALQGLGTVAHYLMSPAYPLIPDRRPTFRELPYTPKSSDSVSPLPPVQG